jgi:branched-chain amino acid transport system ATP-binding protein
MLKLSNVSVNYGVVRALNDVSFDIPEGHITALLGSNGAGKTSLLRAVSGLVPYSGSITFDGTEVSKLGPEKLARSGVLHVPEGRRVVADLTVLENLKLGLTALGGRQSKVTIDSVFEIFPALASMKEREGWMLSGGEQQMLAIGRALVAAPRLLLLDEPSLGLAPVIIKAVYEALATVLKGTTVLLVEQSTANALSLCNEAVVLAQGNVSAKGAPSIFTRDFLAKAYLGG